MDTFWGSGEDQNKDMNVNTNGLGQYFSDGNAESTEICTTHPVLYTIDDNLHSYVLWDGVWGSMFTNELMLRMKFQNSTAWVFLNAIIQAYSKK